MTKVYGPTFYPISKSRNLKNFTGAYKPRKIRFDLFWVTSPITDHDPNKKGDLIGAVNMEHAEEVALELYSDRIYGDGFNLHNIRNIRTGETLY